MQQGITDGQFQDPTEMRTEVLQWLEWHRYKFDKIEYRREADSEGIIYWVFIYYSYGDKVW